MARNTVLMVVAFAVLAAGVFAIEKTQPAPAAEGAPTYIVDAKDTDVQRLDVQTSAGSQAFERAEPVGWKFADSGDQADLSRVSSVVNRLVKLRSSAKVTDKPGDLAQYGLSPAADQATLSMKDGKTIRVLVGSKTPNGAAYYAMVEGRGELHTINTLLVGDIEKLVSEPPIPTPVVTATPTEAVAGASESAADATPRPSQTPTPTVGLPAPSTSQ
ncbi:MAG TPA: DUF4340 domain-containing protein [Chloroflexota bacterium]|nr:DUF4340 domain-containing protein [Chloroflexota bacterium]